MLVFQECCLSLCAMVRLMNSLHTFSTDLTPIGFRFQKSLFICIKLNTSQLCHIGHTYILSPMVTIANEKSPALSLHVAGSMNAAFVTSEEKHSDFKYITNLTKLRPWVLSQISHRYAWWFWFNFYLKFISNPGTRTIFFDRPLPLAAMEKPPARLALGPTGPHSHCRPLMYSSNKINT